MDKVVNDPIVLAAFEAVFNEYEQALVTNDVATLDRLFWDCPHTVRYGAAENLYGYAAIQSYRSGRPAHNLDRTVIRKSLVTIGADYAVANIEFTRANDARIGRQSQAWVQFADGWRVIAAHVSLMDASK